jgi:hypothetical protein
VSDQIRQGSWLLQGDLAYSHFRKRYALDRFLQLGSYGEQLIGRQQDNRDFHRLDPRVGFAFSPVTGQTLRWVYQQWRRPASVATLDQVDTAGIPLDDRLTALGGLLKRTRVQYEWQVSPRLFLQGYADHRTIDNPTNPATDAVTDLNLQDLERLRNRNRLTLWTVDLLEQDPMFQAGRVTAGGLAANLRVSNTFSLAARYQHQQTRNTSDANAGKRLPWLPQQLGMVEANWLPGSRLQLGAQWVYRSERFTDEMNLHALKAGWGAGLHAYWESSDKRLSIEAVADNLYHDKDVAAVRPAMVGLQALYRF